MNPTTIYHYTTIAGLIGIISRYELWASDCRYLNDGSELAYARELFFAEVEKLNRAPLGSPESASGYFLPHRDSQYSRVFVSCFCAEGDLLSQWRGYGADHGYAIGFDVARLREQGLGDLVMVQYGIEDTAQYFANELESATHVTAHPSVAEWHASEWLLPRLATVKHPGFSEEREWRLMKQIPLYVSDGDQGSIKFRPSALGPLAYIVHTLARDSISQIIVGPGPHAATRAGAVREMLNHHDLGSVEVRVSGVPLRA